MTKKDSKSLKISALLSTSALVLSSSLSTVDANAMGSSLPSNSTEGFEILGSGSEVRSRLVAAIDGQPYLADHEKAGEEGKCGENKCGEGKCGDEETPADKDGTESKCGEGSCG